MWEKISVVAFMAGLTLSAALTTAVWTFDDAGLWNRAGSVSLSGWHYVFTLAPNGVWGMTAALGGIMVLVKVNKGLEKNSAKPPPGPRPGVDEEDK